MTTKDYSKEQETTAIGTSKTEAKFAPKPDSWTCSVCLVSNEECTAVCVACGAAKLSDGTATALEMPKTGFHLLNQTTTSSAPNTVSGTIRGNTSSGSPFTFGKSDAGSVNSSPFKFGTSDTSSGSPFTFGESDAGPENSSPFKFETSDTGPENNSPFNFGVSDTGPDNSSPFKFGTSDTA